MEDFDKIVHGNYEDWLKSTLLLLPVLKLKRDLAGYVKACKRHVKVETLITGAELLVYSLIEATTANANAKVKRLC